MYSVAVTLHAVVNWSTSSPEFNATPKEDGDARSVFRARGIIRLAFRNPSRSTSKQQCLVPRAVDAQKPHQDRSKQALSAISELRGLAEIACKGRLVFRA